MANLSSEFFYWYRRYKVRAQDMTDFQQAMVEASRGISEGLLDASVLKGLDILPGASGISIAVSGGIAVAPTGYLQVVGSVVLDVTAAATGLLPTRSLIVSRAFPTDANFISSPTSPFNSVPLNSLQQASAIFLPGTPASAPVYPATGANDVILAGIMCPPGATGISQEMIDYEVRSVIGKNSSIAQNTLHYDNRLRPFRVSNTLMGVKPSQAVGSGPLVFLYPGKSSPSLYPRTLTDQFNAADSFYDFETGAVTGGDQKTAAFTPTIPTGSNSIVCLVVILSDDTLSFLFGTQGTFKQCVDAIRNQDTIGAGAIPVSTGDYQVAYVVVSSFGGVISDIQTFDARSMGGGGSGGGGNSPFQEVPTGTVNGSNTDFTLSQVVTAKESIILTVDGLVISKDEWDLLQIAGVSTIRFHAGSIPQPGQMPYVISAATSGSPDSGYVVMGSVGSPTTVGAGGFTSTDDKRLLAFVVSSGGAVTVTSNPRISAGVTVGQELVLTGTSDTNYPIFNDLNGIKLNGTANLKDGSTLSLVWTGVKWLEVSRNDI